MLAWSLHHRYITMVILVVLLVLSQMVGRRLGFVFSPVGGEEQITIRATLPQESNLQANLREMRKLEGIIAKLPKKELDNFHATVGKRVTSPLDPAPGEATHKTTIAINLSSAEKRKRSADEIVAALRGEISKVQAKGDIDRNILIEYAVQRKGPPVGMPINVEIRGKEFVQLNRIAAEYMAFLKKIKGVEDVRLDIEEGKKEYRFVVNEVLAARSGISVEDVAQSINASFEGAVATYVTRDEENVNIRVRFPERARKRMQGLGEVMVANKSGGIIPLSMVASVKEQPGLSEINRLNYKRIAQVQANVNLDLVTSMEVNRRSWRSSPISSGAIPAISSPTAASRRRPGAHERDGDALPVRPDRHLHHHRRLLRFAHRAPRSDGGHTFRAGGRHAALAAHGQPVSFMSTLGFFSLAGVIVSNTLVLVQFINNMRETGLGLEDALVEAGVIRIRPILLTAGTTVLGTFSVDIRVGRRGLHDQAPGPVLRLRPHFRHGDHPRPGAQLLLYRRGHQGRLCQALLKIRHQDERHALRRDGPERSGTSAFR